jgi:hypothetical protein
MRYLFWGIGIVSVIWGLVDFVHDLMEAAKTTTGYPTNYDAVDMFIDGLIYSSVYFFYAEIYYLIATKLKKD